MLKCKTIKTTEKIYSFEGKKYSFIWDEVNTKIMSDLADYALNDLKKGVGAFTTFVEEGDCSIKFTINNGEEKELAIKVLEQFKTDIQ